MKYRFPDLNIFSSNVYVIILSFPSSTNLQILICYDTLIIAFSLEDNNLFIPPSCHTRFLAHALSQPNDNNAGTLPRQYHVRQRVVKALKKLNKESVVMTDRSLRLTVPAK